MTGSQMKRLEKLEERMAPVQAVYVVVGDEPVPEGVTAKLIVRIHKFADEPAEAAG